MNASVVIRLATNAYASAIAALSRTDIVHDLPWSWTPARVREAIADSATNVVVALDGGALLGFGIMSYQDDVAHLNLLAVHSAVRRRGIASAILLWLERVAEVAGVTRLQLEARQDNHGALAFYRTHGYREKSTLIGMYEGLEDGVRLEKVLR